MVAVLAYGSMGVGEEPGIDIVHRQREDALLAAAAPGDTVLLGQGIIAVVGNGVEVQVKGLSLSQCDAE